MIVFVCSCPSARHAYTEDQRGHCPECVKKGLGNWSCIQVPVIQRLTKAEVLDYVREIADAGRNEFCGSEEEKAGADAKRDEVLNWIEGNAK